MDARLQRRVQSVALAWSRFGDEVRARVRASYTNSIEKWRLGNGFRIPGEFVIVAAAAPRGFHH